MLGWQVHELGEPADVLTWGEIPDPEPRPGQVLVRVAAVACNFPDILVCQGKYQEKPPLPFTPGLEIAGEVVAVGEGAAAKVGDRVLGTPPMGRGGYAELAVLDAESTLPWPEGMTPGQAAGMFVTYQTGICALEHRGRLQPGETLLVHAAAGGVGSAAVQIGKAMGARVIGTAGGPEKCAVVKGLGADEVIDYSSEDLVARVKEITGPAKPGRGGADVIFDPVGGDIFDASRKVVAFEGRILVIGFVSGRFADAPTNHVLVKNYEVTGVHWGFYRTMKPELIPRWQQRLDDLWAAGKIDPLVGVELPLREAPEALRRLGSRGTTGKVVLVP
ncbi:NADPH:quinone oxidoreductase family protein [Pseudonocardia sp.]|jgi:NADPH2:quinone reductase|uniref:NADPH:quinone oxidoreductase family protein n=1 Tax=Pseudonocardia sp. TaxID=60912 RepID=UPI0026084BF1|nr:NADPH:quinone oxidoreductase family protein [Pseudonocardia sp.]MCW2722139.1 NADPH:quinone reductase [Pseudonocardia sp.]MDT7616248.1 NADPH:quinone reductase [Pseudonocardiales bacterium]